VGASPKIRTCLVAAAAAACAGPTDSATVRIEARPLSREAARGESLAAVESGEGVIAVRQTMHVSDPCRMVAAGLARAGERLTLKVVARSDGRACRAAEAYLVYTAHIEELPPGRYELRVLHSDSGGSSHPGVLPEPDVVVMEQSVEVP
jgi:hypothetical protein